MGVARPPHGWSDFSLIASLISPNDDRASPAGLRFSFAAGLSGVPASEWNALFDSGYPFARHAFLSALETYSCVGESTGWLPRHLLVHRDGKLVGAAPLYLKLHSYGEFVFDFAWAEASHSIRRPYYPKLLNAIPFVPAVGPRIGAIDSAVREAVAEQLTALVEAESLSSAHTLFVADDQAEAYRRAHWLERHDLQFQWFNRGDADFSTFAGRFSSDKRKKMLRERRRVAEAGLRFETRRGDELDEAAWMAVYTLYANTYEERGQAPYLTPDFLLGYGAAPGSPFRVILGYEGAHLIAAALTLQGGDTLYGRHWGAADRYHSLHFECCYYQGIELCLREGLRRYDAGTQGEHKLARGFTPVLTRSLHHLAEPRLRDAVEHFLQRERRAVAARGVELMHHSPYRHDPTPTV
ncbi:MAG: family N-acetyltransferase [Hydrocarboniphaga sp.]|uniref:GNAT family N-acetyltransferase n=1 Tax=Hydrocarboniphaga sp. TaxID=2033016 RepID=UPI00261DE650|nr:peptidogalycan biosysnthesis protein [Hydrocarboniphaga sp.]MDB5967680.1 family N-acetyltransferase [Hydrocarboniphaga sp.]